MKKFTVRITRVETYTLDVEVEADNATAAIKGVKEREADNEFAGRFDCPDNVHTHFECVDEKEA